MATLMFKIVNMSAKTLERRRAAAEESLQLSGRFWFRSGDGGGY